MEDTKTVRTVLFIGGCMDGKREVMPEPLQHYVKAMPPLRFGKHSVLPAAESYELQWLQDRHGPDHAVYVSATESEPVKRLIESYRPGEMITREDRYAYFQALDRYTLAGGDPRKAFTVLPPLP